MRDGVGTIVTLSQKEVCTDNYDQNRRLYPLLKWAGGKEQELKYIIPNLPETFVDYYEPFIGGGSVYTALQARHYYINDKSEELIELYRCITNDECPFFFKTLDDILLCWDALTKLIEGNTTLLVQTYRGYSQNRIDETELRSILCEFVSTHSAMFYEQVKSIADCDFEKFIEQIRINLLRKIKRMKELEYIKHLLPDSDVLDNIETALKSAFYTYIRYVYNKFHDRMGRARKAAYFLFIRNFAYSGMFRYNSKGEFNVPYGGIGYNRKNFLKKVDYLRSIELKTLLNKTTIENLDFEDFLTTYPPAENDFLFLDPPYDTEFSTYAKNEFTKVDQERLAEYLIKRCNAQWMLIIKNTDFILSLYENKGLNIRVFDKTYLVSFMNRNEKQAEHLLITNY